MDHPAKGEQQQQLQQRQQQQQQQQWPAVQEGAVMTVNVHCLALSGACTLNVSSELCACALCLCSVLCALCFCCVCCVCSVRVLLELSMFLALLCRAIFAILFTPPPHLFFVYTVLPRHCSVLCCAVL